MVGILYDVGLVLALLIGGVMGLLLTTAHYEQIAIRRREYEAQIAEGREILAALALFRRIRPDGSSDDEAPAA